MAHSDRNLKKAKDLGIDDFVEFTGLLASASEVRQKLKDSDMYVFPTLAEGLPRGIIEAMAVGLPCISSPVGDPRTPRQGIFSGAKRC